MVLAGAVGTLCGTQVDYRASSETLARKLGEAGADSWQLLKWLRESEQAPLAAGAQTQLLARVFGEQFEVRASTPTPGPPELVPLEPDPLPASPKAAEPKGCDLDAVAIQPTAKEVPVPLKEPELSVAAASPRPAAATQENALPKVDGPRPG